MRSRSRLLPARSISRGRASGRSPCVASHSAWLCSSGPAWARPRAPWPFSANDHAQTAANASLQRDAGPPYPGFDRDDYPGDAALPVLRKTFRYTSYWLNSPPGETANSWAGKREILKRNGFGFLVLFTGRTDAQIKAVAAKGENAERLGAQDGRAAVAAAAREGFPKNVLIFLIRKKAGGCCRCRLFIYSHGLTRCVRAVRGQACIALEFRSRREAERSPLRRTSWRGRTLDPKEGRRVASCSGLRTTNVRRRQDAR